MAHIISFKTAKFDPSKEKANPLVPSAGAAVLEWIRANLANTLYKAAEPGAGDRGWRMEVARIGVGAGPGTGYSVGVSGETEEGKSGVKWTVQIHNQRSFMEKLRGKNLMPASDPFAAIVLAMLRRDEAIKDIHTVMNGK